MSERKVELRLPPVYSLSETLNDNPLVQFHHLPELQSASVKEISFGDSVNYEFWLDDGSKLMLLTGRSKQPSDESKVIRQRGFKLGERDLTVDLTNEEWLLHPDLSTDARDDKASQALTQIVLGARVFTFRKRTKRMESSGYGPLN